MPADSCRDVSASTGAASCRPVAEARTIRRSLPSEARVRHLSHCLAERFQNAGLSDVILEVEGEEFRCHRVVLACSSEYFARMFEGGFKESEAPRVSLTGKSSDVVGAVLRLLYFVNTVKEVLQEDPWRIREVFTLAQEWMLPDVSQETVEFVRNVLADENVLSALLATLEPDGFAEQLREACSFRLQKLRGHPPKHSSTDMVFPGRIFTQPARRRESDSGWEPVHCPRGLGW